MLFLGVFGDGFGLVLANTSFRRFDWCLVLFDWMVWIVVYLLYVVRAVGLRLVTSVWVGCFVLGCGLLLVLALFALRLLMPVIAGWFAVVSLCLRVVWVVFFNGFWFRGFGLLVGWFSVYDVGWLVWLFGFCFASDFGFSVW